MQELQPQIAELFRTCIHPTSLFLRVAHVELVDVTSNQTEEDRAPSNTSLQPFDGGHRYATKLVLTDGQLMVQALLHRKLSTLRDAAEVSTGDLLNIKHFQIKKSARKNGCGSVVYLAIEDCHFLKQNSPVSVTEADSTIGRKRARVSFESPIDDSTTSPPNVQSADEEDFARRSSKKSSFKRQRLANDHTQSHNPEDGGSGEESMLPTSIPSPLETRHLLAAESDATVEPSPSQTATGKPQSATTDTIGSASKRNRLRSTLNTRFLSQDSDEEDEPDHFESAKVSEALLARRRQALRHLKHDTLALIRLDPPGGATNALTSNVDGANDISQPRVYRDPSSMQPLNKIPRPEGAYALSQPNDVRPLHNHPHSAVPVQQQPTMVQAEPLSQPPLHPPPPFHTLQSLRNPPPNQPLPPKSYILTTMGFITWAGTTLIHRPGSPFPPKRHLKIIDPSLSASRPPSRQDGISQLPAPSKNNTPQFQSQNSFQEAVTVAVYIDAADFRPKAGTLALFRGMVMQRLTNGDVILNAYGRLKDMRFDDEVVLEDAIEKVSNATEGGTEQHQEKHNMDRHWFVTNHDKIRALGHGSKFDYYLDWWKERQAL
ncbi:hypothetical protein H2198_007518 [Neophaeococcomyces mojaviensis]|uniref:Uncharacterized protein n=1 Tax=Neophaeococcomyces mojaviensis TaxID=3383035 RepID=A0ACC3A006_9EURO|nr:hypothetical protein H2198_007518 [Knufia sp. JES_112]